MDHDSHDRRSPLGPAPPAPRLRVVAAVVWHGDRLLMTQRPPGGPLGLQWEFPGGKIERGETPEQALVREIREELGVAATPHEVLAVEDHDYPDGPSVEISFIRCSLDSRDLVRGPGVHDLKWWRIEEVDLARTLAGDRGFLERLGAGTILPEGLKFFTVGWGVIHLLAVVLVFAYGYRKGRRDERRERGAGKTSR